MKKKKIRLLVSIAGHADPNHDLPDFAFAPGNIAELNSALADAWIEAGIAEPEFPAREPEPARSKKKK